MNELLPKLTCVLNDRYITINNRTSNFKPKNINYRNANTFLKWLNKVDYIRSFDVQIFRSDMYNFQYKFDQEVKIKAARLTGGPQSNKRSFHTLSKDIFKIKTRFLFLARNHKLSPGYLIEAITGPKKRKKADVEKLTFVREIDLVPFQLTSKQHELYGVSR